MAIICNQCGGPVEQFNNNGNMAIVPCSTCLNEQFQYAYEYMRSKLVNMPMPNAQDPRVRSGSPDPEKEKKRESNKEKRKEKDGGPTLPSLTLAEVVEGANNLTPRILIYEAYCLAMHGYPEEARAVQSLAQSLAHHCDHIDKPSAATADNPGYSKSERGRIVGYLRRMAAACNEIGEERVGHSIDSLATRIKNAEHWNTFDEIDPV